MRNHPTYQHDSVVSAEINYDLMVAVDEMCVQFTRWTSLTSLDRERGVRRAEGFLPDDYVPAEVDGDL